MKEINHKFSGHKIQNDTEILIIGTFNPDVKGNTAEFFYDRSRNYLWKILPLCFGYEDLKKRTVEEKSHFINEVKIDFVDLIESVLAESGQEDNVDDKYIDSRISSCNDIISLIDNHKTIRKVAFTRMSFGGIPNIKKRISEIQAFCESHGIQFQCLVTPARFYSEAKLLEWKKFLTGS